MPPTPVSTEVARGLLPERVPHADAAADAGRAALLVAALAGAARAPARSRPATTCTRSTAAPAMPESLALVDALRADGVPAIVSGAGPTVLAFTDGGADARRLLDRCPPGWAAHHLAVARDGARVH